MRFSKLDIPSLNFTSSIKGNPRALFAIGLLALSLIAAIAITGQANRSVLVWSATRDFTVGETLSGTDIKKTKVMLPENSTKYLALSAKLVGSVVIRRVGVGELIPTASLTSSGHPMELRSVPFRITKNDLPNDLAAGQIVDLYALPIKDLNSSKGSPTLLIAHGVSVESIDIKARDIGGDVGIVLRIPDKSVLNILDAAAITRVVVVRSAN
jgi:hypothetical protein